MCLSGNFLYIFRNKPNPSNKLNYDGAFKQQTSHRRDNNYEFDEGLVAIGADIALSIDDGAEGFAELGEFLGRALPGEVPQMEHLRRRLSVPELLLRRRRRGRRRHRGGRKATFRVWFG